MAKRTIHETFDSKYCEILSPSKKPRSESVNLSPSKKRRNFSLDCQGGGRPVL